MEGCISYDLKDAMEKHLKECKACREIYTEELFIDSAISKNVSCDNVKFSSIAADVMKNIDTTKYHRDPRNKLYYSIKSHIPVLTAIAAILFITITIAPAYFNKSRPIPLKPLGRVTEEPTSEKVSVASEDNTETQTTKNTRKYAPKFKKTVFSGEPTSFTPWKKSLNSKYEACVEGKGLNGSDEGIASIIVKNVENGEKWCFQLDSKTNIGSNTPKVIEWWDDENILVIFGYGYASNAPGGDLYILNVKTEAFVSAYEFTDKRNQIVAITKSENDLLLNMQVYEDSKWLTFHKEKWSIPSFDISLRQSMGVINSKGERIDTIGGR